jgi:SAM-dependent methyltransferase
MLKIREIIAEELHMMYSVDEKARASQHYLDPDYSPTDDELKIAQKTSRTQKYDPSKKGRGIGEAITPGYALSLASQNDKILDFGAGKGAPYVEKYRQMGYDIWGVDLPANMAAWEEGIAPPEGFINQFDLVYASNVLNVQSSENFLKSTIRSILKALKPTGIFVGNYPLSPRKMPEMNELMLEEILKEYFDIVSYDKSKKMFTCKESK